MTQGPKLQSEHTFPKENTMGKNQCTFHITGKQNDWVEMAVMQVPSLII